MLEGVALRTAEVVDAVAASLPLAPRISIDGGLTRSAYFRQFLADVLGKPLDLHQDDELTAYGTVALAARGIGAPLPLSPVAHEVTPRADASKWRARFTEAVSRAKGWR